jgi:hypothetical protein
MNLLRKLFRSESGRVRVWLVVLLVVASLALAGVAAAYIPDQKVDDRSTTACVAITAASANYTLPKAGAYYYLIATGNTAYILCGAAGVNATTAVNGHNVTIPEGVWTPPIRLVGPVCDVVGASDAGQLCFIYLDPTR